MLKNSICRRKNKTDFYQKKKRSKHKETRYRGFMGVSLCDWIGQGKVNSRTEEGKTE